MEVTLNMYRRWAVLLPAKNPGSDAGGVLYIIYPLGYIVQRMKFNTFKKSGALGLALIMGVALTHTQFGESETALAVQPTVETITPPPVTASLRYPVAGVIESEKTVDIKARQAGVVRELLVTEGQRVEVGQVLAIQANPVIEAKLGQQAVAAIVTELTSAKQVLTAESAVAESKLKAGQAVTLTNLSNQAETVQLARLSEQVEAGLANFVVTVPRVLRFAQDNKALLTGESSKKYDVVLSRLYDSAPSYLKLVNITYGSTKDLTTLAAIELLAQATSTADLVLVADLALISLDELNEMLALSQSEFLDKNILDTSDSRYTEYLANRESVLSIKQSISEAISGLEAMRDTNEISGYTRQVNLELAKVDEATSGGLADLSKELANEMGNLSVAEREVLLAELNEGILRASHSGVVSKIMTEEGEYVTPGTPLLRLIDTEATEVAVVVPASIGGRTPVGAKVYQATAEVGEVVRQSGVAEAGSQTVFIKLKRGLIGSGFTGELELTPATTTERVVSRKLMQFGTSGPFVVTTTGAKIPVRVLFDVGQFLLIELGTETEEELVPAFGSRL
jgi:multidrug efflux pump subunit AcrA (membrane-fusion protein)